MSSTVEFSKVLEQEAEYLEKDSASLKAALCISGGGIRSATFALGLLKVLARRGLLDRFDYLSTVSGGGYIGSWLSAWQRNDPRSFRELFEKPAAANSPEPDPVRFLRSYSSYLAPRLGLFSADSWTLIAIYLRNLTLNWLTLIPALVSLLLLPRLLFSISVGAPENWLEPQIAGVPVYAIGWLVIGFFAGIYAIANIGKNLPVGPGSTFDQTAYLKHCLTGLAVSAFGLSTFWAQVYTVHPGRSGQIFKWWWFLVFGAAYHLFGWLAGFLVNRNSRGNITFSRILLVTGAGVAGGFLAWLVVCLGFDKLFRTCVWNLEVFPEASRRLFAAVYFCIATPSLLAIIGAAGILYVGWTTKTTTDESQEWWARSGAWVLITIFGWAGLGAIVLFGPAIVLWAWKTCLGALGGSGLTGTLLGKSGATKANPEKKKADTSWTSFLMDHAATVAAPLFAILFAAFLALISHWVIFGIQTGVWALSNGYAVNLLEELPPPVEIQSMLEVCAKSSPLIVVASILATTGFSRLFGKALDINRYSMHGMYRNRLTRAYLGASRGRKRKPNPFTGFDPEDDFPMAALTERKMKRPLHVINCALNLVGGKTLAWQQRKAMSFTVSPLHSGSCLLRRDGAERDVSIPKLSGCYRPSIEYGGPTGISIGTALAISGAAVNPSMGYHSSPAVTFLMTLFNVRLGWWLGNPDCDATAGKSSPPFFLGTLMRELFGLTDASAPYVNLSDGGHFENLALYEMVLRRCRLIVVSDAGADPDFTFEDLGNAVRKIRVDFGIPVRFREIPIYPRNTANPASPGYFAIAEIDYSAVDGPNAEMGYLLYIKPTLVATDGAIPADVRNYAASDPTFPHQTTADQFFEEAQFESYRSLGEYALTQTLGRIGDLPDDLTPEALRNALEQNYKRTKKPFHNSSVF
jgi:hypothetical protein